MGVDAPRMLLRHTVATLAYRGHKAVTGAPASFGTFSPAASVRTPVAILAHVSDLLDWALGLAEGQHHWDSAKPRSWDEEVARFYNCLARFDARLADAAPLGYTAERLFQGPIADALAHIGQIAMLRRLAGSPIRGENYFKARITSGVVGPDQPAPVVEFD
jgi:hypothetical protein